MNDLESKTKVSSSATRRWCSFNLRQLLLAVLVLSILCGWLSVIRMSAQVQRECVEVVHRLGGVVTYDKTLHYPPFPQWLWKYLGIDAYSHVIAVGYDLRDENGVTDPPVTDASLECVASFSKLESLDLSNTDVTDAGLIHLIDLSALRILNLSNTDVTDVGLSELTNLSSLQFLDLEGTLVSLEGVCTLQSSLEGCEIRYSENPDDSADD